MTWQMIKNVVNNPCIKKTTKSIFVNNIECTDDYLIAEAFGKCFSEIAGSLEAEIPQTSFDLLSLKPIKSDHFF